MSTITASSTVHRIASPTLADRMLLQTSRRLEAFAVTRMQRRASTVNPITERARAAADDRRRTAQALGNLGLLPR